MKVLVITKYKKDEFEKDIEEFIEREDVYTFQINYSTCASNDDYILYTAFIHYDKRFDTNE